MHIEAVGCMVTMPNTVSDVGELLSKAHKEEKVRARDMLRILLSSVARHLLSSPPPPHCLLQTQKVRGLNSVFGVVS